MVKILLNNKYTLAQLAAIYTVYKDVDYRTKTVNCCTCGKSLHIEQIEDCFPLLGHYIPRSVEPKLKFHPNNIFAQCPFCNMQVSKVVDDAYDNYICYRFGKEFKLNLLADDSFKDLDKAKQWYINELCKLSQKFEELRTVVLDIDTGEILDDVTSIENPIEEQWDTYSLTYKQDLDELTKVLGTEPIEYERF